MTAEKMSNVFSVHISSIYNTEMSKRIEIMGIK